MQQFVAVGSYHTIAMSKSGKSHRTQDPLIAYAVEHSLRLHPAQKKLIEVTLKHPWSVMLGSADELQLFQNLVRVIGAKKTLDVGVYTGLSALTVALALPEDGKVVACDISDEYANIGKPFWEEAGVTHKIDLRIAPATETLQSLLANGEAETYDFAFIDADKENYDAYYELCLKLVRKNGIIAIDNMLWSGRVCDSEVNDVATVTLRNLAKKIHADDRVFVSFLVVGDGTLIAFKK